MKVLITGGSGFIGSFLAEKFCTIGEVTVLDNLITGNDKNLSKIKNRIRFVDNDIRDQKIVDSLVN